MRIPGSLAVPALAALIGVTLTAGVATAVVRRPVDPAPAPAAVRRSAVEPVRADVDLGTLLATPGPAYRRITGAGGMGPLDRKAFLALAGRDGGTAEAFAELGFRRGYAASWRTAKGDRTLAGFVFEFSGAGGAQRYARGIRGAAAMLKRPVPFQVAGVPAGGLADAVRGADGHYAQLVVVHRGTRAALVVCFAPDATPHSDLITLAQRQYAML